MFGLNLLLAIDGGSVLRKLLEPKTLHRSFVACDLAAANQVAIQSLRAIIVQSTWDKELIVENSDVFDLTFELYEDAVLQIFSLEECFSIDGAVEEAWEA